MKTVIVKVNQTLAGIDHASARPYPINFKPGQIVEIPEDVAAELGAHKAGGLVTEIKDKAQRDKAQPLHVSWENNRNEAITLAKAAAAQLAKTKAQQRELR